MAVYRIFPESDTFLFTEQATGNAGLDEIIEIGGYPVLGTGQTSRVLVKFKTSDIRSVLNNKVGANTFSASLHLYLAEAYELPQTYSLYAHPVYESWNTGVGKFGDTPINTSGCSWVYKDNETAASTWALPDTDGSFSTYTGVTGSYISSYIGGGNWYTGSNGINLEASQTFALTSDHDVNIDVTPATLLHYSGSIDNNGFIVKLPDNLEFNVSSSIRLKYFGKDTNTIYPPYLEFKWDDSSYETGSLSVLSTSENSITVSNNKGKYTHEGKQRFRLHARPKYPVRTFTTGSVYKTNYALPSGSYWGLRDEFTEEMVVPFDINYTKVCCDSTGPYFDIFMDGLQPERYYRVLIKSEIDGTNTIVDNGNTFKVVRNG
jgi:hypothetical protein